MLFCGVLRPVGETEVVLMHSIRPVNARIGARSSYPPNLCPGSEKRVLNSHNNQCIVFVKSVPEADLGWLVDAAASRSQTSSCTQTGAVASFASLLILEAIKGKVPEIPALMIRHTSPMSIAMTEDCRIYVHCPVCVDDSRDRR